MPFFENTEILRRDVQVLDHIFTIEIKTHFILNLQRPTITTANAWPTRPSKTGERGEKDSVDSHIACKYQKAGSTMGNNILSDCI